MNASPTYPNQWIPIPFTCKCGTKGRVDVEAVAGPYAVPFFQHCPADEGDYLPGPVIAVWEEKCGKLVVVQSA
jgi:hypothetical protein